MIDQGIRTPFKWPWKKQESALEKYYKSGDFLGSIPEWEEDKFPLDGDYRQKNGVIYQYDRKQQVYKQVMRIWKEDLELNDGDLVAKGNDIYQYVAEKKGYRLAYSLPSEFMQAAEPEKPSPFTDVTKWFTTTVPQSFEDLAKNMDPLSRLDIPAMLNIYMKTKKGGVKEGSKALAETFAPSVVEAHEKGGVVAGGLETSNVLKQLALSPLIMTWNTMRHPIRTLTENPAEFLMGLMILRGVSKTGLEVVAKKASRGYIEGDFIHNYLDTIPAKELAKYGIDKQKILEIVPKSGNIKTRMGRIGAKVQPIPPPPSGPARIKWEMERLGMPEKIKAGGRIGKQKAAAVERIKAQIKPKRTPEEILAEAKGKELTEAQKQELGVPVEKVPSLEKLTEEQVLVKIKPEEIVPVETKPGVMPTEDIPVIRGTQAADAAAKARIKAAEAKAVAKFDREFGKKKRFEKKGPKESDSTSFSAGVPIDQLINKVIESTQQTALGRKVMKEITKRRGQIAVGILRGERAADMIKKGASKQELEAAPFIREGVTDASFLKNIGREDLISIVENPTPNALRSVKAYRRIVEKDWPVMRDFFDAEHYVDNYVSQLWDYPNKTRSLLVNHFKKNNPFAKGRKFADLQEGIEFGLKPKTTNIAEIYKIYNKYKYEVMANRNLADTLFNVYDEAGNPIITRSMREGGSLGYVEFEHPVFGRNKTAYIHPDVMDSLKAIWTRPRTSRIGVAFDTLNAFLKHAQLSVTLFHHGALTESALAAIGPAKTGRAIFQSFKGMVKGKPVELWKNPEFTKDAVSHGVHIGVSPDLMINTIEKSLAKLEQFAPGKAKLIPKVAKFGFRQWNKFLWDHLHNTYKLMAYEKFTGEEISRQSKYAQKNWGKDLTETEVTAIKNEMGALVNDAFGGQNWDSLTLGKEALGNPEFRKNIQRILLAPDWTLSVLRQASAPGRGQLKMLTGKELMKQGYETLGKETFLSGRALKGASSRYWARFGAYSFTLIQALNLYFTEKFLGEAKFTWENDPGREYRIFVGRGGVGKNIEGERKTYLRFGKQITEPLRYFTEPLHILGSKTAPALGEIIRQFTKHDPGSGWPTAYAKEDLTKPEIWKERIKDVASLPIPFSLKSRGQFALMYPLMRGLSESQTKKEFRKALRIEDEESRRKRIHRVAMAAQENNIDWKDILTGAQTSERRKVVFKDKEYIKIYEDEIRQLDSLDDKIDLIHEYRRLGRLNSAQSARIVSKMKDSQIVQRRLSMLAQEEKYLKIIASDKYMVAKEVDNKWRDDYNRTRNEIEMTFREGDKIRALKIAQDWNKESLTHVKEMADALNIPETRIRTSILLRNRYLTLEKLQTLLKVSLPETWKTPLEKSLQERR